MVKSTGKTKLKTAVFISGRGSNLKSLIKFANLKKSPIQIKFVLSTNNKAKDYRLQENITLNIKPSNLKIKLETK